MLNLIHLTGMEKSLKSQYENANNISARIRLHRDYSTNKQGWFPWVFEQCLSLIQETSPLSILELGCGDGTLWKENFDKIPPNATIILSDISEGMLRDARRSIGMPDSRFTYEVIDCEKIPYKNKTFDIIFANHLLFYCDNIEKVCKEMIAQFDEEVTSFYDEDDVERGYVEVANRRGIIEQFPLVSISIAIVEVDNNRFKSTLEIGEIAAQVKHKAKTILGSTYVINRRKF